MKTIKNKLIFLASFFLTWQIVYWLKIFLELLFPSATDILSSLFIGIIKENLLKKTLYSLAIIFAGMSLGVIISIAFVGISSINKFFNDLIDNIVLLMNPIPSIALFPLCILWFGLGQNTMIILMTNSVIWGLVLNFKTAVNSIPKIYKEIGLNLELSKFRMLTDIYIPACMPYIIFGIKNSFSRAWRTAMSIEMMSGALAAGLGWLINYQRNTLDISGLFSTIIIIIVGMLFEEIIFKTLEKHTIEK